MQAKQHHYLQAMGIQVWQSRDILAGAKPVEFSSNPPEQAASFVEDTVAIESAATSSPLVSVDVDFTTTDGPLIRSDIEDLAAPKTETSLPAADVVAERKTAVVQTANPEFRIASVIFPGICVVVTDVPMESVGPISAEQLTLLKELLLAIKVPIAGDPSVTLFNWPMLRSPDFDQSAEAAFEASQAFLLGQKSKHNVGFVLLMGNAPGQYLLSEPGTLAEKTGRLYQSDNQLPRLLTCSLQQLFSEPNLKAQIWRDLQPLMSWQQEQ